MLVVHDRFVLAYGMFRFVFDTEDTQLVVAERADDERYGIFRDTTADEFSRLQASLEETGFAECWPMLGARPLFVRRDPLDAVTCDTPPAAVTSSGMAPVSHLRVDSATFETSTGVGLTQRGVALLRVDSSGRVWADTGLLEEDLPERV